MTKNADKPILGLEEEVKIYLPNGNFIRRKAKIDTGARTTAIDKSVAKKIGKYSVYEEFHKRLPELVISHDNYQKMKKRVREYIAPKLKKAIPGLYDVRIIPATNGITIRPYIIFEYSLKNKRIRTIASIVDRSLLLYPVLVGKVDMKGFLIDPTKNIYKDA